MAKKRQLPVKIDKYDSVFFNKKIARLDISCQRPYSGFLACARCLIARAKKEDARFLVIKLNNPKVSYERALKALDFKDCGKTIDFKLRLNKNCRRTACEGIEVRLLRKKEKDMAKDIGRDAFRLSYLYSCGFAAKKVIDDYHAEWVENLIKDKSIEVFAAIRDGRVVGFIAISFNRQKKQARIVLIAIDKGCRGLGIGKKILRESIYSLGPMFNKIFVKTQEKNKKAISLYMSMGFKIDSDNRIFCKKL